MCTIPVVKPDDYTEWLGNIYPVGGYKYCLNVDQRCWRGFIKMEDAEKFKAKNKIQNKIIARETYGKEFVCPCCGEKHMTNDVIFRMAISPFQNFETIADRYEMPCGETYGFINRQLYDDWMKQIAIRIVFYYQDGTLPDTEVDYISEEKALSFIKEHNLDMDGDTVLRQIHNGRIGSVYINHQMDWIAHREEWFKDHNDIY